MSDLQSFKVEMDVEYAVHDGVSLTGNLYTPEGAKDLPAVIAIHGGGWQASSAERYQHWGPWLAARGHVLYTINYRLVKNGKNCYPDSVHDVRAAVQFVRANAAKLGVDPERIALMGASAGGHLSALIGLTNDSEIYANGYPDDPHATVSTRVKAVVGVCGVYDMLAQWQHDIVVRPRDNITEIYLGVSAIDDKFAYFKSSPIAYATPQKKGPSFLICWGTDDDVVDWRTQAQPFVIAIKQAGYHTRIVPVQAAPHFFMYAPIEPGSHVAFLAPQVLNFLHDRL